MRVIMIAFTNIEYTIELTEALAQLINITLMLPDKNVKSFYDKINANTNLVPFNQPRFRHLKNFSFVMQLIKKINKLNADVVHIQRGHPWLNFGLPFLKNHTLVNTIHDVHLHTGDKESSKIPFFTHKLAINYAKKIIVHSKSLKSEFLQKYNKSNDDVHVIPRGINSIYNRYIDHRIEEDKNIILFFGRIWPYKGLRYLIEAEPYITKLLPDAKIVIAGSGEDVFQNYAPLMVNPEKFKIYNKYISNKMVAQLFARASVVVFPYIEASQSGVLPLAYAFKKPVVVTDVGSLPDIVDDGKTGFIVPPKDSKKLADKIIYLLSNNEERRKMGDTAFKKAKLELGWEKIADQTIDVYQQAIIKMQN